MFIKAGSFLIPLSEVREADVYGIESGWITIKLYDGTIHHISGFDAWEAVMILKPSALEGKRMKWQRNAWAFHNLVAHPLLQILVWLGFKQAGIKLHDTTVPKPLSTRKKNNG